LGKVFAQLIRKTVGSGRVFELAPREPSRHSAGGDATSETPSVKPKQPSETPTIRDSEWKSPKIWRVAPTDLFENFAKTDFVVQNLLMTGKDASIPVRARFHHGIGKLNSFYRESN
jgi:hypothetical protein